MYQYCNIYHKYPISNMLFLDIQFFSGYIEHWKGELMSEKWYYHEIPEGTDLTPERVRNELVECFLSAQKECLMLAVEACIEPPRMKIYAAV